jgi:signal peptide peptidase SppA
MKDLHLIRFALANEWALLPAKIVDLMGMLAYHASGQKHTPEELHALVGGDRAPVEPSQRGAVAVLPLRGVISHRAGGIEEASGGASVERFTAMYRQAMTNDAISAIVIDVDSPGGTVAGVEGIVTEMQAFKGRKPVVAHANSLMASAAYWIASQADEIVSIPSGTVGSIGVFTAHQDLSAALEQEGVKVTLISAGKFKVEGNPFEPLSDEAKAVIQARVDEAYGTFVKAVAKGRGVSAADVKAGYGEGRALGAKDALAAGMIDRIGTLDDTLRRMSGGKASKGLRAETEITEPADAEFPVVAAALDGTWDDDDRAKRLRLA